jgi:hypothetical protein
MNSLVDMRTSFFKFHDQYIDYLACFEHVKQIDLSQRVNLKICSDCMVKLRGEYASKNTPTTSANEIQHEHKEKPELSTMANNQASIESVEIQPEIPKNDDNTSAVSQLLMEWNLHKLIGRFKEKKIDLFCLMHIDEADIKDLVLDLRSRIYFKKNLKDWRSKNVLNANCFF